MADGCHFKNRYIVISRQKSTDFDKIWCILADYELYNSHMTKNENSR